MSECESDYLVRNLRLQEEIAQLKQREMVLVEALKHVSGCPNLVGDQNRMKVIDNALAQSPSQTADQVLCWHVEWMRTLPVKARMIHRLKDMQLGHVDCARTYDECIENAYPDTWEEGAKLVAIPTLPERKP